MSIRDELSQLLELQALDTQRDQALRSRTQVGSTATLQGTLETAERDAQAATASLTTSNRSLKDAELELASIETKIASYEQKMRSGQLTNSREIANVEKEMHQLSRQRSVLDDKILNLMEDIDRYKTNVADKDSRVVHASAAVVNQRELSRATLDKLTTEITRLDSARAAFVECLSNPTLLSKYEALRSRPACAGLAVVVIDSDSHCGGCHMPVSQQYVDRVKESAVIVNCENCGRILAQ